MVLLLWLGAAIIIGLMGIGAMFVGFVYLGAMPKPE